MTRPALRYKLPSRVSDRSVVETMREAWTVKALEVVKSRRTYLDTADARVLRGGWTLAYHWGRSGPMALEVSSAASDAAVARCLIAEPPQWAADLPAGEPWRELAAAVGERRLLFRMTIESVARRYAILDDEGKTTVRVHLERHSRTDGQGPVPRLRLVSVAPVRGYERYEQALSKRLSDAGLPSLDGSLLTHLGGPSIVSGAGSKASRANPMDRSMPVARAVSLVLSSLRKEMVGNEPGVRDQVDIEFLHDYRVASRRARSVLNQVRGLLPRETAETLSYELRWLGTLTGPARDLDVQLAETHEGIEGLEGMRRLLAIKRAEAQDALLVALDSPRYKSLLETWEQLEEAAYESSRFEEGAQPAGPVIDRYIYKAHRRVLRIGSTINDASPAELLHDLRKKTKALRYMIEMFAPLYSESELKTAVRELKALQDNLGEFQDSQVQADAIRDLAEQMLEEKFGNASELMDMGRIADALEGRQIRARADFAVRFDRFSSPEVTKRYRRMFGATRRVP